METINRGVRQDYDLQTRLNAIFDALSLSPDFRSVYEIRARAEGPGRIVSIPQATKYLDALVISRIAVSQPEKAIELLAHLRRSSPRLIGEATHYLGNINDRTAVNLYALPTGEVVRAPILSDLEGFEIEEERASVSQAA